MRKTFGSPLSGMVPSLNMIVAELTEQMIFMHRGYRVIHDKGSRLYLVMSDKDPLESDTVEVLVRDKMNKFHRREIPWRLLRFVEIQSVTSVISERCWRGMKDEMEQMVKRIKEEKAVSINDFGVNIDI